MSDKHSKTLGWGEGFTCAAGHESPVPMCASCQSQTIAEFEQQIEQLQAENARLKGLNSAQANLLASKIKENIAAKGVDQNGC